GHVCHLAAEGEVDPAELAEAVSGSQAELAVIRLPGRLWVPALETDGLAVAGGLLLVSMPEDRSLAALAVDELARRRLPARIATCSPPPLPARRALAGIRAGGRVSESAGRIVRRLLALGGGRGQALPAVLGAGLMLILAALVLATIGGAATGRGRVQRAADLAALSAVRSMRDDVPGLLAPARLPDGSLNPTHL